MKTKLLFLFLLPCLSLLKLQAQNKECDAAATQISDLVKDNKYDDAYQQWTLAGKCTANESIYLLGEKLLTYKIEAPATEDEKRQYITSLADLYGGYDKNFPANKNGNLVKKAMILHNYNAGTPDEVYALLDRAFKTDQANFTNATALYLYFDLFFNKFKAGDKAIKEDDVFEKRDEVSSWLHHLSLTATSGAREYKTASDGVRALVASITSCEKLNSFYNKNFAEKKSDTLWLEKASATLMENTCTTGPLFLNIASEWYKLKPTAKSAYNLGIASIRNKNQPKAVEYLNASADMEMLPSEKAKTYYMIASILSNNPQQAVSYLKKALAAKPSFGKAYLLMAQMYSVAGDCGQTPFEKKAIYFLAAQTARKAGDADASIKPAAVKQAESYLQKAPSKAEIKAARKSGKKITYSCWINETVTIPEI